MEVGGRSQEVFGSVTTVLIRVCLDANKVAQKRELLGRKMRAHARHGDGLLKRNSDVPASTTSVVPGSVNRSRE